MKVYILTVTKERCFGNGSKIVVDDVYLGAYKGLEIAKDAIRDYLPPTGDFRKESARDCRTVNNVVYTERYEDRYSVGDSDIYYIIEKDFSVPEIKENEDLKKRVKNLEKEIEELKSKQSGGFHTEPVEKKEAKSHVKFW